MITSLLTGLTCIFFILGHSTLLFFRSQESPTLTVMELIIPWPKNGKIVSLLCIGIAIGFFIELLTITSDLKSTPFSITWKIILSMTVLPLTVYFLHIIKRLQKKSGVVTYSSSNATKHEWGTPIIFVVFISLLSLFF